MTHLKGQQEEVAATVQQLRDQNAVLQAQVLLVLLVLLVVVGGGW